MNTASYLSSQYDAAPVAVAPPRTFENFDLYPAVSFNASAIRLAKFAEILEREDEHGTCRVAHFLVSDTLVILYQSALDFKNHWTVFVDMQSCIARKQIPTKLGESVIRSLTMASIEPDWINYDSDVVYRSGRRKLSKIISTVAEPPTEVSTKSLLPRTSKARRYLDTLVDTKKARPTKKGASARK